MNNKIKLLFSASEIDALLSKINSGNVLTDTELLKLQNLDTSVFATKTDLHTHTNKSVIDGITAEKVASWNSKSTFSGDYNDLANKPTIPAAYNLPVANQNTLGGIKVGAGLSITADGILSATGGGTADSVEWESVIGRPTRLSDFTNDSGFITGVPDEYITETELNAKGYLTEHQDISGLALKSELHSHNNKAVIDAITSDMTTKWNRALPFVDSYVDNCDNWLTNGYTKVSATATTNQPSVCTGSDRWGVLFYISENATNGTGMQMYFPIDGPYAGRVFTRRIVNRNAGTWNLVSTFDGDYNNLTNKPTIPSIDGLATETYVDTKISENAYDDTEIQASITTLNEKVYGNITPEDTNFFIANSTDNLVNESALLPGYINEGNAVMESSTYVYTPDYIRVTPGKYLVATWKYLTSETRAPATMRFVSCYNENFEFLRDVSALSQVETFLVPSGVAYVKISFYANNTNKVMVEMNSTGVSSGEYVPYEGSLVIRDNYLVNYTRKSDIEPRITALESALENGSIGLGPDQWIVKTSNDLSASPITIDPSSNIASNKVMVFSAQVDAFESVTLGHGETSYGSTYITIDNTNVTVYEYYSSLQTYKTFAHGLTISGFLDVIIDVNAKEQAVLTINTSSGMKKENIMRWAACNGNIFARCTNSSLTNCSLRWTCKEFNNDIQIYGDSYASMYANRSIYRLIEWGYDSFLLDAYSGRGSAAALTSLQLNLQYSNPKYIVWMMGMNDPDSTTTVNANWQSTINSVISICQEKDIELILTTIPNVKGGAVDDSQIEATIRRHNFKNDYIRNSGYRYIDCALAVGADENGNWYDGMLYTDGVHPTDAGAIALASRIVQDFPEITLGVSGGDGAVYDDTSVKASIQTLKDKINGNIQPVDTTFFTTEPTNNLVNEGILNQGYMSASGYVDTSALSYVYTNLFKVIPGKYIVATWLNANNDTRYSASMRFVTIYDANKNIVSDLGASVGTESFLVPEGAAYARVTLPSERTNKIMVELSDNGSPSGIYEPFTGKSIIDDTCIGSDIARANNVLAKTNTTEFIPTEDYNPATKKYVDDSVNGLEEAKARINDIDTFATFEVLEGYTYTTSGDVQYCYDVDIPFTYFEDWTAKERSFFYNISTAKVVFTFSNDTIKEAPLMTYNRVNLGLNIPAFMVDDKKCSDSEINHFYIELFGKCSDAPIRNCVSFSNAPADCTSIKITTPIMLASTKLVDDKVAGLLDSAPETLNTLNKLATALGNDANFATTVSNQMGSKVDKVDGKGLSTNDLTNTLKANYDTAYAHSQSTHFSGSYNDLVDKPTIPSEYTHPSSHPASMITGLSTVATSGSYNDLSNKPTIPTKTSELENDSELVNQNDFDTSMNNINDRIGLKINNSISVAEIISVAKSYYNVRTKEDGTPLFTYDTGHTPLSDNYDSNSETYAGAIDCSTYIGLVLRGIPFLKSPYSHLATGVEDDPNSDLTEDNVIGDEIGDDGVDSEVWNPSLITENKKDYPWAINPFNWKLPATQSSSPTPIRRASQLAQWMFERGMSIPLDETFSNLEPGDIIFWAKTNSDGNYVQPNRYKHISHVALCIGKYDPPTDDVNFPTEYPFKHTMLETTTIAPYVLNRTLEKIRPNEVVMICRPDLGSLSTENFAGNIKTRWGVDDISELYRPGIYYLTSSMTKGLPDNITNGIYLTLKVERTMTIQGKIYSLIQTLINAKTNDSVYRRTQYCYSHLPNKTSWTPWKALDMTKEGIESTLTGDITTHTHSQYLTEHQDLSSYATKQYVQDYVTLNGGGSGSGGSEATDEQIALWNAAYEHSQSAHAPSNAQKNSDITKLEIEAKLTGDITTHTHSQYLTEHQSLANYALKSEIPTVTNDLTNSLKANYNTAYTHSQSSHAPVNAQKNSDITKLEIEAKLTGDITTHTHSQYLTEHQSLASYALKTEIPTVTNDLTNALKANYDAAYTHSQAAHAPSNAQKNSDITKAEIEAKLTGNITTHTHSQYLTEHQSLTDYATKKYVDDAVANAGGGSTGEGGSYDDTAIKADITKLQNKVNGNIELTDTKFYSTEPTKNLANEEALTAGYLNNKGTAYNGGTSYVYTDFLKVTPGKYMVASWLNTNNNTRYTGSMRFVAIYDADKNVLADLGSGTGVSSFLIPDGAAYARVSIETKQINKLMVELTDDGNMSAEYVSFFGGKAFVSNEYISSDIARTGNVLTKTNNTEFIPTSDYNPATKKYVDDAVANGGNADTVNNFRLWKGTQAEYDAITSKDSNTIYMITG